MRTTSTVAAAVLLLLLLLNGSSCSRHSSAVLLFPGRLNLVSYTSTTDPEAEPEQDPSQVTAVATFPNRASVVEHHLDPKGILVLVFGPFLRFRVLATVSIPWLRNSLLRIRSCKC